MSGDQITTMALQRAPQGGPMHVLAAPDGALLAIPRAHSYVVVFACSVIT